MSTLLRDRGIIKGAFPAAIIILTIFAILPGIGWGQPINEGFNNFDTGTRPAGWIFNGCNANSDTYTTAVDSGVAPPSIKLDATGDFVQVTGLNRPDELNFWVKGMATDASSALLVEEYYIVAGWTQVTNIQPLPTFATGTDIGPFYLYFLATDARFTYTKSVGDLAFDDVDISVAAATPTAAPSATPTGTPTLTPPPTATPTPNTDVCNPSFEEIPDDPIPGWTKVADLENYVAVSVDQFKLGIRSCTLSATGTVTYKYTDAGIRSCTVPVIGGDDYIISGWFFVADEGGGFPITNNQFKFNIEWLDSLGVVISTDSDVDWSLTAFDNWEKREYTETAPGAAVNVTIYIAGKEIVNANNNTYIDLFRVASAPTIKVTAPVTGDAWYIGASEDITWTSVDISPNIDIHYSTNGTDWAPVATNIADSGTYNWNPIPNDPSSQAQVRVRETGGGGVSDESGQFSIAVGDSINVEKPSTGDTWYYSSTNEIVWNYGPLVLPVNDVDLEYSDDGGTTWTTIAIGVGLDSKTYNWTIPDVVSSNCLVRVRQQTTLICGESGVFTISPPSLSVTSPSGGETWYFGDYENITWTSTSGISGNVDIDYSTNGVTGPWGEIIDNQPNSGSYPWTIPNDDSSSCRVRISEVGGVSEPGISAADFTIVGIAPPPLYLKLGWKEMAAPDTVCSFESIEAFDPQNVWVGCSCGLVYHWDGIEWTLQDYCYGGNNIGTNVNEFVALSADNVYGGGSGGYLVSYDGYCWTNFTCIGGTVYSIDALDPDHIIVGASSGNVAYKESGVWSVSDIGNGSLYGCVYLKPDEAYIMREKSGDDNTTIFTPVDGNFSEWTEFVDFGGWGISDHPLGGCIDQYGNTLLWAVGDCGNVFHYNGSYWFQQTKSEFNNFKCVEVLAENNVWAFAEGMVYHYNGSEWIIEAESLSSIKQFSATDNSHVYGLTSSKIYTTYVLPTTTPTPEGYKTPTPTPIASATPVGYKTPTPTPVSPICNNSFEESPDLTCWWKYGTAASIEKSGAQHYDGSYSCLFESPTTAFTGRGVYSEEISIIGGEPYIFSGWYFVDFLAGSIADTQIQFEIWWSEGGTRLYSDDFTESFTLSDFNTWEEKVFNATAPDNADEVEIYISCKETANNDNEVFIDLFNLDRPPGIKVTAPSEGVVWYVGESNNITWESVSISGNVDIHYSVNNGASWTSIATNIANTDFYNWPVPNDTSSQCLVRVRETVGVASDESGQFMIADADTINVLSPQGGETWYQTGLYDIEWSAGPAVGGGTVNLDYSTDNGSSWTTIAAGVTVDSSPYSWTIPAEDSDNCLVRVLQTPSIYGQSPAVFTITPPTFIVTSPAGGEYWYYGASYTITWTSTQGITGNVNIDYSTTGPSGPWSQIASNQPNSGSYFSWTVPNINSSNCRVRISAVAGISEPGISATNFILRGTSPPAAYRPLTWTVMNQIDTSCSLYTIEAWDENNIWVGGSCGVIFFWDGSVWVKQDELSNIASFKAFAADDVWAGGLGGGIFHYDGVWSYIYSAPNDIKSIDGCDPNYVMASSSKSTSMYMSSYTSAGGWSSERGSGSSAHNVVYLKPDLAYVCVGSSGGVIYKSVDRFTWDAVGYAGYGMNKNPFAGCLDQNGNPQLWVVGDCGFINHYDGGTDTWSTQTRVVIGDGWPNFESVAVLDENNVWASGGGKVYHYNGSEWIVENNDISTFYTISVVNNGLAYAVGSTGSQKIYIGRAVPTPTPWHPTTPTPNDFKTPSPTPVPVPGPISGTVYDRVTGVGVNNLYVRALPAESGLLPGAARTDSNGNYTATKPDGSGLETGFYYMYVDSNEGSGVKTYRSQYYNQKDSQSKASAVGSNSIGIDFPLYKVGVYPTPAPTTTPDFQAVRVANGDYSGDGLSDIAIFRQSSGLWAVRAVTRLYFGTSGDIPVSGDYDGDGTADVALFRGSAGLWAIRNISRTYFGGSSDLPVPGDYDGDGSCDIGIFRDSSGLWAVKDFTRNYFGAASDQPVAGDYDGDGLDDFAIFRGSTSLWALKDVSRIYYGSSSDNPVPGDYSGTGTASPAIYRPTSGLWAIRNISRVYFGSYIDQPSPAGFTGADNISIFRPSAGLWAIRGITRVYYGSIDDQPVTR